VEVAVATGTALRRHDRIAGRGEILEHEPCRFVDHHRARGHEKQEILGRPPVAVGWTARLAVFGPPLHPVRERRK